MARGNSMREMFGGLRPQIGRSPQVDTSGTGGFDPWAMSRAGSVGNFSQALPSGNSQSGGGFDPWAASRAGAARGMSGSDGSASFDPWAASRAASAAPPMGGAPFDQAGGMADGLSLYQQGRGGGYAQPQQQAPWMSMGPAESPGFMDSPPMFQGRSRRGMGDAGMGGAMQSMFGSKPFTNGY